MKRLLFGLISVSLALAAIVSIIGQRRANQLQAAEDSSVREAPRRLHAGTQGIGRQVANLSFTDSDGQSHQLSHLTKAGPVVIALTGTGCPLCLKYAPTLAAIEDRYHKQGVTFVFVNPNQTEQGARSEQAIADHGFDGAYINDGDKQLCSALQAETTTEVFVLDEARTLLYRGAVDDQYGLGYALEQPTRNYLTDALDAVLTNRDVPIPATSSPGCEMIYDQPTTADDTSVTYHRQVARIIQANCVECHRAGGIAPMPFETYAQVKDYAGMIKRVVHDGTMPPWFAAASTDNSRKPWKEAVHLNDSVHWANDRSLSDRDKQDLQAWVTSGAPEGDPADAPQDRVFPDGWLIGQPDKVFEFAEPVRVRATGTMPYRNIKVTNDLQEDMWVQAMEIRPSEPGVVHHVIVSVRGVPDESRGYWAAYVPGNSSVVFPPGFGRRLPKGATLNFQMHYTPNGKETFDSTRLGLVFSKEKPTHEVKVMALSVGKRLRIPAHEARHEVPASLTIPANVEVLALLPHMHLRGRAARYDLSTGGKSSTLLNVPDYDFNWQLRYELAEPLQLQRGDQLHFTAMYDNSKGNPANPDPARMVGWGDQTDDEMHLGYVEYVQPISATGTSAGDNRFSAIDADGDGQITRAEARAAFPGNRAASGRIFDRLDSNGDGSVDEKEFARLNRLR